MYKFKARDKREHEFFIGMIRQVMGHHCVVERGDVVGSVGYIEESIGLYKEMSQNGVFICLRNTDKLGTDMKLALSSNPSAERIYQIFKDYLWTPRLKGERVPGD